MNNEQKNQVPPHCQGEMEEMEEMEAYRKELQTAKKEADTKSLETKEQAYKIALITTENRNGCAVAVQVEEIIVVLPGTPSSIEIASIMVLPAAIRGSSMEWSDFEMDKCEIVGPYQKHESRTFMGSHAKKTYVEGCAVKLQNKNLNGTQKMVAEVDEIPTTHIINEIGESIGVYSLARTIKDLKNWKK